MKKIILSAVAAVATLSLVSCNTDFDNDVKDIQVTSGEVNFSKYVALGNSLTSGFRDYALYIDGQNESYPAILAQQMKLAGGGEFFQPMMADNIGGLLLGGMPIQGTKLYISGFNNGSPVLSNAAGTPSTEVTNHISGPINNFGVPGLKSYHLVAPGYGNVAGIANNTANPYFVRFASSGTTTLLQDAVAQQATFFSLWGANNDVLSYATSGGVGVNQTGNLNPATYGANDISDPDLVAGVLRQTIEAMKAAGATGGVIANTPSVTSIPLFTTVPYNPVSPAAIGSNLTMLNTSLYGPLKAALTAFGAGDRIELLSATSANPVLIVDESLPNLSAQLTQALTPTLGATMAAQFGMLFGQARQSKPADRILLTTASVIGTTAPGYPSPVNIYGITLPLEDKYVLTEAEVAEVETATDAINARIKNLAATYNLAFVDAHKKMVELNASSGIQFNGVKYSAKFVTGGTFSLDGIHLTGKGYAIVANEFIKAINAKYKSNLPEVNPNNYSSVKFP